MRDGGAAVETGAGVLVPAAVHDFPHLIPAALRHGDVHPHLGFWVSTMRRTGDRAAEVFSVTAGGHCGFAVVGCDTELYVFFICGVVRVTDDACVSSIVGHVQIGHVH